MRVLATPATPHLACHGPWLLEVMVASSKSLRQVLFRSWDALSPVNGYPAMLLMPSGLRPLSGPLLLGNMVH